jgi:hypothetical protein
MRWARDRLGELVDASQQGLGGRRLSCPACQKAVYLKRGVVRTAHFAHFALVADASCDNYFPTSAELQRRTLSLGPRRSNSEFEHKRASGASLCLTRLNASVPRLVLRLPRLDSNVREGRLVLQSGLGRQEIPISDLVETRFAPVSWSVPPAKAHLLESQDTSLIDEVEEALGMLRGDFNYFPAGSASGQMMDPEASLEFGTTYWLLTQREIAATSAPAGISVVERSAARGWRRYEVTVSDAESFVRNPAQLEAFLRRPLRARLERISVMDPVPSYFDLDGAAVYGEETLALLIEVPSAVQFGMSGSASDSVKCEVVGHRKRITALRAGELRLEGDGRVHQVLRIRESPNFRPKGVVLQSSRGQVEIFQSAASLLLCSDSTITIVAPSKRTLQLIEIDGKRAKSSSDDLEIRVTGPIRTISAGGFGSTWAPAQATSAELPPQSENLGRAALVVAGVRIPRLGSAEQYRRWAVLNGQIHLYPQIVRCASISYKE